jgi:hypothetical protein
MLVDNVNFILKKGNERRKWIHAFDGVTCVFFITSLCDYDQQLEEDRKTNRMIESVNLFKDVCNDRGFKKKAVIIFYNKNDIFTEKIKKVDLKCCFSEYSHGCNYKKALGFIQEQFTKANTNKKRPLIPHVTTATDTNNIKVGNFYFNF